MKINRNTRPAHYHSDSEIIKKQSKSQVNAQTSHSWSSKKNRSGQSPDDWDLNSLPKEEKKTLFPNNISLKSIANQLLSEEVYDDLISFLIIIMSLPLLLVKRLFSFLQMFFQKLDQIFTNSVKKVNKCLEDTKKNRLAQRRFSKDTKLELLFKKKQLEEKARMCKENKLDLVLDLDETLIHCSNQKPTYKSHEFEIVRTDNLGKEKKEKFYFSKRPFLEDFLEEVSMFFNVHIYTAGDKNYADMILNVIDPKNKIQKRLYRNDCTKENDNYVKDLLKINPDLSRIIMVDNSEEAVKNYLENSFIIKSWYGHDKMDSELEYFTKILIGLAYTQEDVRNRVRKLKRELKLKYLT